MIWRCLALLVSLGAHYAWLSYSDTVQLPQLSGGSQQLPVAMSISMVTVKPAPTPAPKKPPAEPVKDVVEKPVIKDTAKKPVPVKQELIEPEPAEVVEEAFEEPIVDAVAQATSIEASDNPPGLESLPVINDAAFRSRPTPPVYPKLALRKRQQGEALVQALVDPEGATLEVKLVRSSGFALLDKSALKAVQGWQFEAARIDGAAISAWVEVPVAFTINR